VAGEGVEENQQKALVESTLRTPKRDISKATRVMELAMRIHGERQGGR